MSTATPIQCQITLSESSISSTQFRDVYGSIQSNNSVTVYFVSSPPDRIPLSHEIHDALDNNLTSNSPTTSLPLDPTENNNSAPPENHISPLRARDRAGSLSSLYSSSLLTLRISPHSLDLAPNSSNTSLPLDSTKNNNSTRARAGSLSSLYSSSLLTLRFSTHSLASFFNLHADRAIVEYTGPNDIEVCSVGEGSEGLAASSNPSAAIMSVQSNTVASKPAKTIVSNWIVKRIGLDNLQIKDTVIVVMGPTGSGRSSFINMVVTADEEDTESAVTLAVGHTLQSCTSEITMVELRDPTLDSRIVLVDTPGFDDTNKSDTEILTMVADWLERTYKNKIHLAGIIYLHRISDNRMAGTPLKNLEIFKKLCGKHALKNVVLATTMWDEVEEEQGNLREIELRRRYWKEMLNAGSKTFRYKRTVESAWAIIQHFVNPYTLYSFQLHQAATALRRSPVLLQRELVDNNTPLPETEVGQTLLTSLEAMIAKQQQTLKMLLKERKQNTNEKLSRMLEVKFESQREQLRELLAEAETMKVPFVRRVIRLLST